MAITFSGACSVAAPCVYDGAASQATGAASTGIGLKGADGAIVPGSATSRIGGAAAVVKFDTDGNAATP